MASLLPVIPAPLAEASSTALEWPRLREHIAARAHSPLGRAWIQALEPTSDRAWLQTQHQRTDEIRAFLTAGGSFTFHGLFDPTTLLDKARIEGAALEGLEIASLLTVAERVAAWRSLLDPAPNATHYTWPSIFSLSSGLLDHDLAPLLRQLRGKIEPDGNLADDASPELRRLRRAMERQHRAIEESLRRAARHLREEGSTQSSTEDLITLRNDRFVIPVKAEFKRKVPGVIHGSSSTGQTVFIEPLETIEQNNELVRLLDEEQAEIHRILVAMTRALGEHATPLHLGCAVLAEVESHTARARFARDLNCTPPLFTESPPSSSSRSVLPLPSSSRPEAKPEWRDPRISPLPLPVLSDPTQNPVILSERSESKDLQSPSPKAAQLPGAPSSPTASSSERVGSSVVHHPHLGAPSLAASSPRVGATTEPTPQLSLTAARHPLLELRMRAEGESRPVPLTITFPPGTKQLILSGPNTGGKTVSLKTLGLLAVMAQSGIPVPAESADLPLFTAIYADIGDAQSIERNLSSFSAHVVNVDRISRQADAQSLVLLDELGSATDPEEGAALAVAVAAHFLALDSWTAITTHLTSLKVYASTRPGVLNAAVGFDQQTLTPTYELRLGVPGASAGLNIAERLGMSAEIIQNARAQMTTQTADIGAFLDQLHDQLTAAATEREALQSRERELSRERAKLEIEGRLEQKARTKELEAKLQAVIAEVESQLRDTVKAIDDKTLSQKIARDSAARMARAKREFSDQFNSTVVAHNTRADKADTGALGTNKPKSAPPINIGDLVHLKSLNRQARVERAIDAKTFEVALGPMKMRVDYADIASVEQVKAITPLEAARRRGGVTIQTSTSGDSDYMASEINVIGRTADDATTEVERFLDRAFLAGLPRIRIVHGTGMGILRRTLRNLLKSHPHVATVTEPPQNQGGQGATEVELRQ